MFVNNVVQAQCNIVQANTKHTYFLSGSLSSSKLINLTSHNNVSSKTNRAVPYIYIRNRPKQVNTKQPISTHYLGHVTSYQPIRDQYFLTRAVPHIHLSPQRMQRNTGGIWGHIAG
eukprot:sb/3476624/